MPRRRPPPRRRVAAPLPALSSARVEDGPDGYQYHVRSITAARAVKTYRCPGCDHQVRPGIAHVVVWRVAADGQAGSQMVHADDRRHWHASCWANRRSPTRKWS